MEGRSEVKGKNLIIFVLVLALLCCIGFIVYDKYFVKENSNKVDSNESSNINNTSNNTVTAKASFSLSKKTEIQRINFFISDIYFDFYVSKEGKVYFTIKNNGNTDEKVSKSISDLQSKYSLHEISGYCDGDNYEKDLYPNGSKVNSIELDLTGVMSAYHVTSGQDYYGEYVVFVMEDGTVSRINLGKLAWDNSVVVEKNVDNLTNIVTIVDSSTTCVPSGYGIILAIEADGTQHKLS